MQEKKKLNFMSKIETTPIEMKENNLYKNIKRT